MTTLFSRVRAWLRPTPRTDHLVVTLPVPAMGPIQDTRASMDLIRHATTAVTTYTVLADGSIQDNLLGQVYPPTTPVDLILRRQREAMERARLWGSVPGRVILHFPARHQQVAR